MRKTKSKFSFILVSIIFYILFFKQANSQTTTVRGSVVTVLRSIGDTIIFGATDFDFMPDGSILMCDKLDYKIKHLNRNGTLINEFGARGKNNGEFTTGPIFLSIGKSSIAVADYSSPRVQLFTHTFKFIKKLHAKSYIMGLQFDSNDNLWIGTHSSSKESTKIFKYNRDGILDSEIFLTHASDNIFDNVYFFSITTTDTLIVTYQYQNVIEQYYNNNFIFCFNFPGFPKLPKYTISEKNRSNMKLPIEDLIKDISVDTKGNVYILGGDYAFNPFRDVFIFNINGTLISLLTLPVKSRKIAIDIRGFLWSLEQKGTVLTQYKITSKK